MELTPRSSSLVPAPEREQRLRNQAPRRWVRVVSRLTVGGAVAILVVLASMRVWSTEAFADVFGTRALVVTSGSMAPVFRAGDVVVVRAASPRDIRVGDIVTYRAEGGNSLLVTHRVVDIERVGSDRTTLVMKGDANPRADAASVEDSRVVGRYSYRIPRLGAFVVGMVGMPLLLLAAAIVLASAALMSGRLGRKPDRDSPGADPTEKRERRST